MVNMTSDVTAIITCMTESEKPFLQAAVNSVIQQTYGCKLRIYVKTTNQWVGDLIESTPMITIRYVPLSPPGIIRNIGASESDTEWLAFLDGDDLWQPRKIEMQLAAAISGNADVIATDNFMIDEDGKVIACGLGGRNIPMTSSWLVRRKLFDKLKFTEKMPGQDVEWWKKSREFSNQFRIPSFLIKYRLRQVSVSSATPSKMRKMKLLKASRIPAFRYFLIVTTWVANKIYRYMK